MHYYFVIENSRCILPVFLTGIIQAVQKKDIDLLRDSIRLVEQRKHIGRLKAELAEAKKLLGSLQRTKK